MKPMLQQLRADLVSLHHGGMRLALLFDYDGTLTPLVDHPALAKMELATLRLLERLATRDGVAVGIISSRGLDDLRSMVSFPGIYYVGSCGLEADFREARIVHPEASVCRHRLTAIYCRWTELLRQYPGGWVEDKPFGLTLHYRKVAAHLHDALLKRAVEQIGPTDNGLRFSEGPMVLEVGPSHGWDKGLAVREIVEDIGRPVMVVYAGDSADDGAAFRAATELGGIGLAVGDDPPAGAQLRLRDPQELAEFLDALERALGERV